MKQTRKTTTKKPIKKNLSSSKIEVTPTPFVLEEPMIAKPKTKSPRYTLFIFVLLVGLLIGLVVAYGGTPVMALLNGQPIFRWEAAGVLFQRYGQQTMEGMITERLVTDEAKKENVTVSQSEIDVKEKDILKNFGSNMSVDEFLKFQGMQKADFDNQIKLQLIVQKILGKNIAISNIDIDNYIASNGASLTSTNPATLRDEAQSALFDEKISEKLQTWLQEIKAKATVQRFF